MVSFLLHSNSFFCCHVVTFPLFLYIGFQIGRKSFYKYILPLRRSWATHIDLIRWLSQRDMVVLSWKTYSSACFFLKLQMGEPSISYEPSCLFSCGCDRDMGHDLLQVLIRYMSISSNHDFCVPLGFSGSGSRGTGLMAAMSSMVIVNEITP